jgi:ATP-dependent RNA helicase DeaD
MPRDDRRRDPRPRNGSSRTQPREAAPRNAEPEDEAPPPTVGFDEIGLSEPLLKAVRDAGFETPTRIQGQAIPVLLSGRDLIGQAQTGTGKTAAFGLPAIPQVDPGQDAVQALILAPTREMAVQVA